MVIQIFRNSELLTSVEPLSSSTFSQKKQSEDMVTLSFHLANYIDIKIGDYITYRDAIYTIRKKPTITDIPKDYAYECIFEGKIHDLTRQKIFLYTPKTDGGEYKDYAFPLYGSAQTFLSFIVDSLNRNGGDYVAGTYAETATVLIEFNNWNGFEAISAIAETLEFNWHLDGNVLNFDSRNYNTAYIFQTGQKRGFTQLVRSRVENETVETVVYGYGSTSNLPPRTSEEGLTYDSNLLTENRLCFDGVDGDSKLENNVDLFGCIESIQEFDIQPEYTGEVTSLDTDIRSFFDTNIAFNINDQLLAGIQPKITFVTGKLIGLTFNISFDNDTKKVTMDYYSDESGDYPNAIIFAEVGDTYKIFDIVMPQAYIDDAKLRLKQATQDYLDTQSVTQDAFEGSIDEQYIQKHDITLQLGDLIRVISPVFEIDNGYEIDELSLPIITPEKYTIKFGDILPKGVLATLVYENFVTSQSIYNIEKNSVTNNEVNNIIGETTDWEELG